MSISNIETLKWLMSKLPGHKLYSLGLLKCQLVCKLYSESPTMKSYAIKASKSKCFECHSR
uniref:Uncharacterized protein n=1 Tax=Salix viminalis TaxID=40686 RepID=A0A6N2LHS8_SALVM